ncbi:MAG: MFS transporter [Holosporaceae bacterium]|jgi:PAT family beta-lactamase induction signal transducer AmpG|nr:MFS transporter [Holosporaceae bacterium]
MKLTSVVDDFIKTCLSAGISVRFCAGFTCGVPFLLRLTVLDLWLKECGVSNTAIGFFTLLQWPFALKFLWAPFIEKMDFPILSKIFGRRRGWAIASQVLLFAGLSGIAASNPQTNMVSLALYVSLVAFADGCQDISLYAYQLDKASTKMFGPIAGIFVFGYKVGMFFSKSITLYLAYYFGWNFAYAVMAFSIFLCMIFIFCTDEPKIQGARNDKHTEEMIKSYEGKEKSSFEFTRTMKITIFECLVCPFKMFIKYKGCAQTIALIMLYRAGDRMVQKMAKPFYVDMGFSKLEIANVVQVFGTIAALIGGVVGGYLVKRLGTKRAMYFAGIIHAIGCFSYAILSYVGHDVTILYLTVFVESITGGAIATAFIAFLYSLCNKKNYASTQYALLWAFYELGGTISRTISGAMADALGWTNFFLFIPFVFIPSLVILQGMTRRRKTAPVRRVAVANK